MTRHHVPALFAKFEFTTTDNSSTYSEEDMPPAALTGTVEDSKAKRQERLKSRFRDRGGCVFTSFNAFLRVRLTN